MSEYIVRMPSDMPYEIKAELNAWYINSEPIVRCRDCKHGYEVFWPDNVPSGYLDCHGYLAETWDYERDEPNVNPVPPDGFCAWACRKEQGEQPAKPSNDNLRPESVVSAGSGRSNETFDAQDSREKLLEDLERHVKEWREADGFMRIYGSVAYAQVKELLDRQEAITERESYRRIDDLSRDLFDALAELREFSKWLDSVYVTEEGGTLTVYTSKPPYEIRSMGEHLRGIADKVELAVLRGRQSEG